MAVVLLTLSPNADAGKLPMTVSFGDTVVALPLRAETGVTLFVFV